MSQKDNFASEMFREKLKFKLAVAGGFFVLILLVVVFLVGRSYGKKSSGEQGIIKSSDRITESLLYQQMEKVGELGTAKYYYTNMGKYENAKEINGMTIPFTNKSFIISYDGIIKAGINLQNVKIELKQKKIVVMLPEAEVLSHEVIKDSVVVYDEKNSIFNGLSISDVTKFEQSQNEIMEEKAKKNGIMKEAIKNAKSTIKNLFQAFILEEKDNSYTIEFKEVEENTDKIEKIQPEKTGE